MQSIGSTLVLRQQKVSSLAVQIALVVAGSLLLTLSAYVKVPLPFTPVPISGQTFAVLLIAAALGSRLGVSAVALYLVQGALGLPVLSGGAAGLAYMLGPTGGYLIGFLVAAAVVGKLVERGMDRSVRTAWIAFVAGQVAIYACGAAWLGFYVGWPSAWIQGVVPFLVGDALKVFLAAALLPAAWKFVGTQPK